MTGHDAVLILIAGTLIVTAPVDFIVRKRLERLDGSAAAWMRLFAYDLSCVAILLVAALVGIAADTNTSVLELAARWDWPLTGVNIVLAILFRWWVVGLFRRAKEAKANRSAQP